jgi:hypothetical protein
VRSSTAAAAALLLAAHAALAIHALWSESATFDETSHLPAGMALVATGEAHLNPQHPPLVKLLAGLATAPLAARLPLEGDAYREGREWEFGREVLFGLGNDHVTLLRAGRLPVVALSLLAGLAVFLWSRARFGDAAGCFSLALYAFEPTALAHAGFVTMDAAVTAGALATLGLFWSIQRRGTSLAREASLGLALGVALAAKFSALFLLPAMALAQLVAGDWRPARARLRPWLVALPIAALVAELTYLGSGDRPRYLRDLAFLHADHQADYLYYLAGEFRAGRFPAYFPVALAVKSALPGLAAGLAGLVLAARRGGWRDDVYLWLPAAAWLGVHALLADNLGVRYVIPVQALLFVAAGGFAAAALRLGRAGAAALAIVAGAQAGAALLVHPHHLAYFNPLAGGTRAGPRWLDDSNLDWGQELLRLPGWLAERGIERVRLLHFGTAPPSAYGVPSEPLLPSDWREAPRPGAYVISAHWLVHGLHTAEAEGAKSDWLRRYEPADVLGGSLYLYVFPEREGEAVSSQALNRAGAGSRGP